MALSADAAFVRTATIGKTFGAVRALVDVSLAFYPGECVGIVGHNGAGKSTLMNILSGVFKNDHGALFVGGNEVEHHWNTHEAIRHGIRCVFQELSLCPNLSLAENMRLRTSHGNGLGWRNDYVRMKLWAAAARLAFAGALVGQGVAWGSSSVLGAAAPSTAVYVTNSNDATISVIDATTDAVVATISVGERPWAVTVSSDGTTAYVCDSASNAVSVVDMRTRKVRATIGVGVRPSDLVLSPDGRFLYVAVFSENAVAVVDTSTEAVVAKIPVGGADPYGMAISPSGDTIYTANVDGSENTASSVSVIDTPNALTHEGDRRIQRQRGCGGAAPMDELLYATSINSSMLNR